jgi:hypothetical protein
MPGVEVPSEPTSQAQAVPYRHLSGWTVATAVALGAVAFILGLLTESVIADARNQGELRDQIFVARSDLAAVHTRWVTLTRGAMLVCLIAALLWLAWQYQAHANLRSLGGSRIPPWLATALWLIPGLNVLLSWVGLGDLWVGSDPLGRDRKAGRATLSPVLLLWWTAFTTAATLTVLAFLRTPRTGASAEQLIARDHLLVAACLTGIAAAIFGIVLLVKIDGRLDLKEDAAGHPTWRAWSDDHRTPGNAKPSRGASQRNPEPG